MSMIAEAAETDTTYTQSSDIMRNMIFYLATDTAHIATPSATSS